MRKKATINLFVILLVMGLSQGCGSEFSYQTRIAGLEQRVQQLETLLAQENGNPGIPSQGLLGATPGGETGVAGSKPGLQPSSPRCQGKTKKGPQCKRDAEPGSSYCWQH